MIESLSSLDHRQELADMSLLDIKLMNREEDALQEVDGVETEKELLQEGYIVFLP